MLWPHMAMYHGADSLPTAGLGQFPQHQNLWALGCLDGLELSDEMGEFHKWRAGATDWTRTSTSLRTTGPKPVASTNFATVA